MDDVAPACSDVVGPLSFGARTQANWCVAVLQDARARVEHEGTDDATPAAADTVHREESQAEFLDDRAEGGGTCEVLSGRLGMAEAVGGGPDHIGSVDMGDNGEGQEPGELGEVAAREQLCGYVWNVTDLRG